MYFDVVEPVIYFYSNVSCQHSQQTRDVDQCWSIFDPLSATLAQHQTRHGNPNTGLKLAQRRKRWANIIPALGQRLVFDRLQNRKH